MVDRGDALGNGVGAQRVQRAPVTLAPPGLCARIIMPAAPIWLEPSRAAPYVGLAFYGMGLLIDAKRAELIPAIADLLEALGQSGFRIDPKLFDAALALTGE